MSKVAIVPEPDAWMWTVLIDRIPKPGKSVGVCTISFPTLHNPDTHLEEFVRYTEFAHECKVIKVKDSEPLYSEGNCRCL